MTYARRMAEAEFRDPPATMDSIEATIKAVIERCAKEAERPCSANGVVECIIAARIRALAEEG